MNLLKKVNVKEILSKIFWLIPVLFLFDDILGFNGYQFTIGGISIRIILFCITVFLLCGYVLWVVYSSKMTVFKRRAERLFFFDYIKPLDYVVLGFIVCNMLWATVVPLAVRGEMNFALKDFSTILVLVLYFPISFLIRTGKLRLKTLEKTAYYFMVLLAVWHIVMHFGEVVQEGFYESYYDFIDVISFGTAVRSSVVKGYGIIRIIQVTSIFLPVGGFLAARYISKGRYIHFLPLALFILAICITYTKSIWFGFIIGLAIYVLSALFVGKDKKLRLRLLSIGAVSLALVVVFNYAVFNNTIFQRAFNTVQSKSSLEEQEADLKSKYEQLEGLDEKEKELLLNEIRKIENAIKDAKGTQASNSKRAEQNTVLLSKWQGSKWVGYGYGAYAEDLIRNEQVPYMYESTLPALVMKIGVLGSICWVVFIACTTVVACKTLWKRSKDKTFWWLGVAISFALAVQTNPFLFTFTGFSTLLYLLISIQEVKE